MLITLIALASTLGAIQDAPAASAPVAVPAPAAQTSDSVTTYLKDAESQLYDPQAAGLRSLEFDLPVEMPGVGLLGQVHVTWVGGGQTTMTVTPAEPLPANVPAEYVEPMAQQAGTEVINTMLNRPISMLLQNGVATAAGVEDGLVKFDFDAPDARAAGVEKQSYLFDDDGILRRSVTLAKMSGMSVTATQHYNWKPVSADSPLLLAESQSVEADMGIMVQKIKIDFAYTTIDGVIVASQIQQTSEMPMGGTQRQVLAVTNLVVNGKTAELPETAPAGG
jgi:hypothetical protein